MNKSKLPSPDQIRSWKKSIVRLSIKAAASSTNEKQIIELQDHLVHVDQLADYLDELEFISENQELISGD